jgi:hypothetical protein
MLLHYDGIEVWHCPINSQVYKCGQVSWLDNSNALPFAIAYVPPVFPRTNLKGMDQEVNFVKLSWLDRSPTAKDLLTAHKRPAERY